MAANEQQQKEDRESGEPAHHARRPMNAFLIFCKRHRTSVRTHFPNLENRAVTRVLGEWWATLHPDQKQSYINLAQEYKDAFLNANPDFKWYKLPAPPLRTLSTRPTNKKQEIGGFDQTSETAVSHFESSSSDVGKNAIQPGKLADESQLGGLSSLFTPQKIHQPASDGDTLGNFSEENSSIPKPPKKRYTELPIDLEQKRDCKADLFSQCEDPTESNNNEEHRFNEEVNKNESTFIDESEGTIDETSYRGERSCKGVRYQKFLAEQQRTLVPMTQGKRKRFGGGEKLRKERRNSISSNVSEKTDSLSSEGGNSTRSDLEHLVDSAEGRVEASKPEDTETEGAEPDQEYAAWNARKRFNAEDFNLEKKIEALPSLSLEEFQEKKKQQRTKKKKIHQKLHVNSAKRGHTSQNYEQMNHLNDSHEETEKALLVGSQKRKARKQSITRNASATVSKDPNDKEGGQLGKW
ncbi:HMG box transcription factor BBX isoform X2 [Diachasma alloeum]|uniref:HMG box transcription factor BBX isoform X2 n=1 Tax=Diachasma alloeum TaxID=454923 RepID=UPI00073830B0|nr:HMG box transcription factor BBX isoform X2 [Diachasma alloeum]